MIRVDAVCSRPSQWTCVPARIRRWRPHHAYIFANRRSTRPKVLVHDGIGIWLAARRLHERRFVWLGGGCGAQSSITREQLAALVVGLPW